MSVDKASAETATGPQQLGVRDWWQVIRRTAKQLGEDHVTLLAGGIAYAWFLALFPGLIAAVMVYGLVTDPADVERQVADIASGLPSGADTLLTEQMSSIASGSESALSLGLAISLAVALWTASAGIAGLVEAVNIAYGGEENRNFFAKRALALILTIGFLVFLVVAIGLIGVLPVVLDEVGLDAVVGTVIGLARWVGLVLIAAIAIGVVYRVAPDGEAPKVRWLSLGAVIATAIWIAASIGMAFFVENFGSYGETYGSLAGVVVLMLWFWVTALAVLFGAELNAETEVQGHPDTTADQRRSRDRRKADASPSRRE